MNIKSERLLFVGMIIGNQI